MSAARKEIVKYLAVRCFVKHVINYYAELGELCDRRVGIFQFLDPVSLCGHHLGERLKVVKKTRVELRVNACAQVFFSDPVLQLTVGRVQRVRVRIDSKTAAARDL